MLVLIAYVTTHGSKNVNFKVILSRYSVLIPKKFQQYDTLVQYFISCKSLYMFRVKHSPIIRSSIKLYLQHLVLTDSVWPAVVMDESELLAGINKILYKSVILLEIFWNWFTMHGLMSIKNIRYSFYTFTVQIPVVTTTNYNIFSHEVCLRVSFGSDKKH
jgi:hypothetical protein